jgi:hypothetical protein
VALWSILLFGCLAGMSHALEADHLAAVAALSARRSSRRQLVLRGAWWGAGHTVALFAICSLVIFAGLSISPGLAAALELCVGVMIVGLGAHVLLTISRRRIHSHAADPRPHADSLHDHGHRQGGALRALAVGLVHGAAGSAALLVLAVAAAQSAATAVAYVVAFGLGSIAGMAALSFVVSFPLTALQRGAAWLNLTTTIAIGAMALVIGGELVVAGARTLSPLMNAM